MSRHTNTASLSFAASKLLTAVGRLCEHELWDGEDDHRRYIERDIREASEEITQWVSAHISPAAAHAAAIARGHYFDGKSDCVTSGGPFDGRANAELANAEDGSIQGRG